MNSNSTPFKKRNNPFSTGGTSIFDETPEPAPKVEEKPKRTRRPNRGASKTRKPRAKKAKDTEEKVENSEEKVEE